MTFRSLGLVATMGVVLAFGPAPVLAHPHVFIENRVMPLFQDGKLVGFAVDWLFDDISSDEIIRDFDRNKDKKFDAAEIAAVEKGAFSNLKNFGYFTHIRIGKTKVPVASIADFKAAIEKSRVRYRFTARFAKPLLATAEPIHAGFYDDSYYVDVGFAEKAPLDLAQVPAGCTAKIEEDKANPIYYGMVFPQTVVIQCRG